MNKKNLVIVITASVALALIVGAIIFIVAKQAESDKDKDPYRFETTEHMGVAQLISKADVEKAVKGIGDSVRGPQASGTLHLDGVKSETATYYFIADGQEVRLDLDVKIYPETKEANEQLKPENVFRATESEEIKGVGQEARMYFPIDDVTTGERQYSLIALENRFIVVLSLTMPADAEVALSRAAGQHILQELGKKIDLSNLN